MVDYSRFDSIGLSDSDDDEDSFTGTPEQQELARYQRSAERGELYGILNMSVCHWTGDCGAEQNATLACKWFEKGAERGDAEAQCRLASFLFGASTDNGSQLEQMDVPRAVYWWEKAAAQGDADAMWEVANRYLEGEHGASWATGPDGRCGPPPLPGIHGVPEDIPRAMHWFREAANKGHAKSQYSLACCYLLGKVPYDEAEGLKWLNLAAEQGDYSAVSYLSKFESMTPERAKSIRANSYDGTSDFVLNVTRKALTCIACGSEITSALISCDRCQRVGWCSTACQLANGSAHEAECEAASAQSIKTARFRAMARDQLKNAMAHGDISNYLNVCSILDMLRSEEPLELDLILLGAKQLSQLNLGSQNVQFAAAEGNSVVAALESVVELPGWSVAQLAELRVVLRSARAVVQPLREASRLERERRRCESCGQQKLKPAFSESQWRKGPTKGNRRCKDCQAGKVVSLEQRALEAEIAEEEADYERLAQERFAADRARIQAELERRNAVEHKDDECPVCFEQIAETERCSLSCKHWLCAGCLIDLVRAEQAQRSELSCPMCRTVIADDVLQRVVS